VNNKRRDIAPPLIRRGGRLALMGLIVVFACAVLFTVNEYWPYELASISQPSALITDERTSDGIPVYRLDERLKYTTSICNQGVNINADRFLDSYGRALGTSADPRDTRSASFLAREATFYAEGEDPFCLDDIPVSFGFPAATDPGFYKLRTNNSYSPNFLTSRTNVTVTELFLLLDPGMEIP